MLYMYGACTGQFAQPSPLCRRGSYRKRGRRSAHQVQSGHIIALLFNSCFHYFFIRLSMYKKASWLATSCSNSLNWLSHSLGFSCLALWCAIFRLLLITQTLRRLVSSTALSSQSLTPLMTRLVCWVWSCDWLKLTVTFCFSWLFIVQTVIYF